MVNTRSSTLISNDGSTFELSAWLELITRERSEAEQRAIIQACHLATEVYQSRRRISGEPYIIHVLTVADILADLGMETEVLVAAILHETEGQSISLGELEKRFGRVVARLVDGVIRMEFIDNLNFYSSKNQDSSTQRENLRRMLLAMVEDVRVVLIKLADRLHNMRTLGCLPIDKQQQVAQETLDIFVPLANRLGIWQIKWELEDLSLRYIEPKVYQYMAHLLDERRIDREHYIQKIVHIIKEELKREGIIAEVSGRPKHIYSIWHKMRRKGLNFDQIFDVRALRVLVNTVKECYMVLGIIHNKWHPLQGEFDDYIAKPKSNNYQSLHTAVVGPEQKIFEVQIRTHAMHHHAELGVAAHWRYKEEDSKTGNNFEKKIAWLRQLPKWKEEEANSNDFINRFKSEISEDRIYVLSPQGKIVDLPLGATPLDFAYYIHTELGHRCRGAKVNHHMMSLTYPLKNGDQVEILTSKEERPSRDWLNPQLGYLKTSRARAKVRQWLRKQDAQQHLKDGRALLERELRRLNIRDLNLEQLAQHLHFAALDDFLLALGRGDMTLAQVTHACSEQFFSHKKPVQVLPTKTDSATTDSIYIKGVGGLLTHTAACCKPVPYDSIVGYITKGRGVVVHRRDCPNALRWQDEGNERLIEVTWVRETESSTVSYPVDIQVRAYDRRGLLRDISSIIAEEEVNIVATQTLTDRMDNSVSMTLSLEINDLQQLSRILAKIDGLANVMEVSRKT